LASLTRPIRQRFQVNVTLIATSTDNVGVTEMYFYVDGTNISSAATSSPYTYVWNSTGTPDGTHTLYAVGEDAAGNYATTSISITVNNTTPPSRGLVGYWPFDASTTNWTTGLTLDESGTGDNGHLTRLSTSTAPISGAINQALQFNLDNQPVTASNYENVSLATTSATSLNTNFTVSAWIAPASSTPCCQSIINNGQEYSRSLYNLSLNYPASNYPSIVFGVTDGTNTATLTPYVPSKSIPLNAWTLLTCDSDSATMSCYMNGLFIGSTTRATVGSGFSENDNWFSIGTGSSNGGYFYGGIDDVRVYNHVLTPTQILQLYDQSL
jgi:Concanavalin A-like lectin/glucanases superfamily/Bacterial Ig domain